MSQKGTNETGEDFVLEGWNLVNKKNINLDFPIKIGNDLLIPQVKKDPNADYKIIKTLGEGSYGKVYLVSHNITGAIRAMKVIKKVNNKEVLNEINVLKKMDHPNVAKLFEIYIDDENYYLITEYCSGGELFGLINDIKFNEMQTAYIMLQLFMALNYCHKMEIIHRDLKPENILIVKNENNFIRIKICDFRTSQIFKKGEKFDEAIGSLFYIAPEVIKGEYNFKCDLWSCGVIMYILLTNKLPFFGDKDEEIISSILSKNYDTERLRNFSESTRDLLSKLLERDISKRINAEDALNHKFFEEFKVKSLLNEIKDKNKIEKFVENLRNYKRKSILQETTIAYLIHNFPDLEEVNDAYKLFNQIDLKANGKISNDDLNIGLSLVIQSDKLRDDMVEIFANLDLNKNNYLGFEDFAKGVIDKNCFLDDKILKFAFKFFDKDNKGEITIKEISYIFKDHLTTKNITEILQKIISEVDDNGDGKITYDKFCKIMKNINI